MALNPAALTDAIDRAFATEWVVAKPTTTLPAAGAEDRRLLFAAVARGLLEYLAAEQAGVITAVTLVQPDAGSPIRYNASETALNIEVS